MAGGYDGSIRIDTEIDTGGFDAGMKEVESSAQEALEHFSKQWNAMDWQQQQDAIVEAVRRIGDAWSSMDWRQQLSVLKDVVGEINPAIDNTAEAVRGVAGEIVSVTDNTGTWGTTMSGVNNLISSVYPRMYRINRAVKGIKEITSSMGTASIAAFGEMTAGATVSEVVLAVLATTIGAIVAALVIIIAILALVVIAVIAVSVAMVKLVVEVVKFGINATKQFIQLINTMSQFVDKTSEYGKEIWKIKSLFNDVRGAVYAAFSPLVSFALPYIEQIVARLVNMLNTISMIVAGMLGQSTVMQYVAGSADEIVDSTGAIADNVGDATKAAKGALAAFDELNVLQMQTAGGGGGAGKGKFMEVEINGLWAKLAAWWEDTKAGFARWWIDTRTGLARWWIDTKAGFARWRNDTKAGLVRWWNDTKAGFAKWWTDTKAGLVRWWVDTKARFAKWWTDTKAGFAKWWNDTKAGLANWRTMTLADFIAWFADTKAGFAKWWTDTTVGFMRWGIVTIVGFMRWRINVAKGYALWAADTLLGFGKWAIDTTHRFRMWVVNTVKEFAAWRVLTVHEFHRWHINVINTLAQIATDMGVPLNKIHRKFADIFGSIRNFVSGIASQIANIVSNMVNRILNLINGMIKRLNKLPGINLPSIPNIPITGSGTTVGNAVPLAQGAVIPPNAAFAAVLGDQTSGRNLEAPEALIRQIVREESQQQGREIVIRFEGTLAALVRELKPHIDRENVRIGSSLVRGMV